METEELKTWIEMKKEQKKDFSNTPWIPLYEESIIKEGEYLTSSYKEEVLMLKSALISTKDSNKATLLDWSNLGEHFSATSYVDNSVYIPSDLMTEDGYEVNGIFPVLVQNIGHNIPEIWHLHQDIVIALKLYRQGDVWVCPDEDYTEVVKLIRNKDKSPKIIEIKAEFLKDYLCARNMELVLTSYREHLVFTDEKPDFNWEKDNLIQESKNNKWEGFITETTNNGNPIGAEALVTIIKRTDIDFDDEIPVIGPPTDNNLEVNHKIINIAGDKTIFNIRGRLWKEYYIKPGSLSTRVRGDSQNNYPFFKIDAAGNEKTAKDIGEEGCLWFAPEVIPELLNKKDGKLEWYTKETASISCSFGYSTIFGINDLGLITVFAEDIADLPLWQQRIWAGYNVTPEGGLSKELYDSQIGVNPADSKAPEGFLEQEYKRLNNIVKETYNIDLFRPQKEIEELLPKINRFQSLSEKGFYTLAKDLARIVADGINQKGLKSILTLPKEPKLGSLKLLEAFIFQKLSFSESKTKDFVAPFFGLYDLRQVDAHLAPTDNNEKPFQSIGIDSSLPPLFRGTEVLVQFVTRLSLLSEFILITKDKSKN